MVQPISEMNDRERAACFKTAVDQTIQTPRATEIREEIAAMAPAILAKLSPEDFRLLAAVHTAAKFGEHRKPARSWDFRG
jgi:hypothetical protein